MQLIKSNKKIKSIISAQSQNYKEAKEFSIITDKIKSLIAKILMV